MDELAQKIANIRQPWVGSPYYDNAEKWTYLFWDAGTLPRTFFDRLDLGDVIELACGYGRHAERAAPLARTLVLIDVIAENLDVCRARLAQHSHLTCVLGDGQGFTGTADASVDAIYCYDAMVHFDPDIIDSYLRDTARVLRPGGKALFHHSNYAAGKGRSWGQNPHARNYMTQELFAQMARAQGLAVSTQQVMDWGGVKDLDCLTLLER